jgi:putative N6-adenine-specific DNA methylase
VLLRFGQLEARDFAKLERELGRLAWRARLPRDLLLSVRVSVQRCRLYHSGAVAERVTRAIDRAVGVRASASQPDDPAAQSVWVRGVRDHFTVSLDTSGELLHRRGWRQEGGEAPLRETLAATVLAMAQHHPDEPLCDPMCGSGTLAIEAAHRALGRAPGLHRSFAFERFVDTDGKAIAQLRDEARSLERTQIAPIVGADLSAEQLAVALRNVERAGVARHVQLMQSSVEHLRPASEAGLLVTNPPYGKRVGAGDGGSLKTLYRALAAGLGGPFARWRAAVLVEDRSLLYELGMKTETAQGLSNGGLRVWVGQRPARRGPS